jgi:uncharacterized protein YbjT (DUF2867 family)
MKLLVCGGAGFIGSHFARIRARDFGDDVVVLDKLTYAGRRENLQDVPHTFVHGAIEDPEAVAGALEGVDAVVNFALNGSGTPPAEATPRQTACESSRWLRLHGIVPVHVDATPTTGPSSRPGSIPIARKCARAPARSTPDASPARARRLASSIPSSLTSDVG